MSNVSNLFLNKNFRKKSLASVPLLDATSSASDDDASSGFSGYDSPAPAWEERMVLGISDNAEEQDIELLDIAPTRLRTTQQSILFGVASASSSPSLSDYEHQTSLLSLPNEVLIHIFSNLVSNDFLRLPYVCTRFRDIVTVSRHADFVLWSRRELWMDCSVARWRELRFNTKQTASTLRSSLTQSNGHSPSVSRPKFIWRTEFIKKYMRQSRWITSQVAIESNKAPRSSSVSCLNMIEYNRVVRNNTTSGSNPSTPITTRVAIEAIQPKTALVLVTGSFQGIINVWDARSGKLMRRLPGHRGPILDIQFDMKKIISAGEDGQIRIWSVKAAACIKVLTPSAFALQAEEPTLPAGAGEGAEPPRGPPITSIQYNERKLVAGQADGFVCVFDMFTRTEEEIDAKRMERLGLTMHNIVVNIPNGPLNNAAEAPARLSTSQDNSQTMSTDRKVSKLVLKLHHNKPVKCMRLCSYYHYRDLVALTKVPPQQRNQASFPKRDILLVGTAGDGVAVWDLNSGIRTGTIGAGLDVNALVWDCAAIDEDYLVDQLYERTVAPLPLGRDEHGLERRGTLVVGTEEASQNIYVFDLPSGRLKMRLSGHPKPVTCMQLDGNRLVTGGEDKSIRIWDLKSKKPLRIFDEHSWSPRGLVVNDMTMISGSFDELLRWHFFTEVQEMAVIATSTPPVRRQMLSSSREDLATSYGQTHTSLSSSGDVPTNNNCTVS